jgi:ferredoxin
MPFVERLISQHQVIGPKRKGSSCVFGLIREFGELQLNYTTTILPPRKLFFPQEEALLTFTLGERPKVEPIVTATPCVLFGVHPCDLWGIWEMDQVFADKPYDSNYLKRREASVIVGWDCQEPDERCFCTSTGTSVPEEGHSDLFFTDVGEVYAVQVGSAKGRRLIEDDESFQPARNDTLYGIQYVQEARKSKLAAKFDMDVNRLPLFLETVYDSPVWQQKGERCHSCGSCVMVCPTCFCFDVVDRVALDLQTGTRIRVWDGCVRAGFASVASGENFREEASERVRHRMYRKFQYLMTRYGKSFCVGCGRCSRECLADIHPVEIIHQLVVQQAEEEG